MSLVYVVFDQDLRCCVLYLADARRLWPLGVLPYGYSCSMGMLIGLSLGYVNTRKIYAPLPNIPTSVV